MLQIKDSKEKQVFPTWKRWPSRVNFERGKTVTHITVADSLSLWPLCWLLHKGDLKKGSNISQEYVNIHISIGRMMWKVILQSKNQKQKKQFVSLTVQSYSSSRKIPWTIKSTMTPLADPPGFMDCLGSKNPSPQRKKTIVRQKNIHIKGLWRSLCFEGLQKKTMLLRECFQKYHHKFYP